MKTKSIAGLLCALVTTISAPAAVIVNYAMTGPGEPLDGTLFAGPTSTAPNVSATSLQNQAGAGPTGSQVYAGNNRASTWAVTTAASGSTFAAAFTDGNYLAFSITPADGYQIALTNITFRVAIASTSATSNRAFFLVSESDPVDFSSSSTVLRTDRSNGGGGTIASQATTTGNTVMTSYNVPLTSFDTVTGTQYFRFYLQAPDINQALAFDDIIVNGDVSLIPEPSSALLVAGALAMGLARRRRSA